MWSSFTWHYPCDLTWKISARFVTGLALCGFLEPYTLSNGLTDVILQFCNPGNLVVHPGIPWPGWAKVLWVWVCSKTVHPTDSPVQNSQSTHDDNNLTGVEIVEGEPQNIVAFHTMVSILTKIQTWLLNFELDIYVESLPWKRRDELKMLDSLATWIEILLLLSQQSMMT